MRANKIAAVVAFVLGTASVMAQQPATHDVTAQFVNAGVTVDGLRAVEVGGVVVLRGRTLDPSAAEKAASVAQSLGYARVANLIQVADLPDDDRITRAAERSLSTYRGLDGTRIVVDSNNGVVQLRGKFSNELQKDMAISLVRKLAGVRSVQVAMSR